MSNLTIYSTTQSVDAGLLHYSEEFIFIYFTVTILVELIYHGLQLIVWQIFAEFSGYTP